MIELVEKLYAIKGRSITGPGLRATLDVIGRELRDLGMWDVHALHSGTAVFDWTVPDEWTLRRATCVTDDGFALADTDVSDLHVVNYSLPGRFEGELRHLKEHVISKYLRDKGGLPYVTSYYKPVQQVTIADSLWGDFGSTHVTINIDTTLAPGVLNFGELVLPGASDDVVLFSAHCCHPQLANDNLASIGVLIELARHLASEPRHFTYCFVFAPGTIGALSWLTTHEGTTPRIAAGLVLACAGDSGPLTYKNSRRGNTVGDWLMTDITRNTRPFTPWDYDERQFNSPAFDLPIGRLTRTPNGEYPQYHTSADVIGGVVTEKGLADTLAALIRWTAQLEELQPVPPASTFGGSDGPLRVDGRGEPQLGKHGLYEQPELMPAILWCLNLADGHHTPAAMAERSGLPREQIDAALGLLREKGMFV